MKKLDVCHASLKGMKTDVSIGTQLMAKLKITLRFGEKNTFSLENGQ